MLIDLAYAQGAQPGGGGSSPWFGQLFLFAPLILIFYFLILRPQQKQRKDMRDMLSNLQKGDRIVTKGGIVGTIDKVEEQTVRIELGNGPKLRIQRDYVDRVIKE